MNKKANIVDINGGPIKSTSDKIKDEAIKQASTPKPAKTAEELNLVVHPNMIFARKVDKSVTKSGIILPEGTSKGTPIAEILAIGSNAKKQYDSTDFNIAVGDVVYVDGSLLRPAIIDGVEGAMLMPDGIFGKVKTKTEDK